MDRDISKALASGHFSEPLPLGKVIGPTKRREDPSGMILSRGRIIKQWGPVKLPEMTFSIAKSYLSLCAGVALDQGLIADLNQKVSEAIEEEQFKTEQNKEITWRHLLQQTSEWEGELWGKPDLIDRNRDLNLAPNTPSLKGSFRELKKPGEYWEYNDVRVNALSLALMKLFRRPLPEVLDEFIMKPIGASDSWKWHGYENSFIEIDGKRMQSVPGGAHLGGGLFISTSDHARVGLLVESRGRWKDRQIISEAWIDLMIEPCPINPDYGCLWWLNNRRAFSKAASEEALFAMGVGRNLIWIDRKHQLVVVVRWLERDSFQEFSRKVVSSLV